MPDERPVEGLFGRLVGALWRSALDTREKSVLTALLTYCDTSDGSLSTQTSAGEIAQRAGWGLTRTREALHVLEQIGHVRRIDQPGGRPRFVVDPDSLLSDPSTWRSPPRGGALHVAEPSTWRSPPLHVAEGYPL